MLNPIQKYEIQLMYTSFYVQIYAESRACKAFSRTNKVNSLPTNKQKRPNQLDSDDFV